VNDHPLVVPPGEPLGALEHLVVVEAPRAFLHVIHRPVVEQQKRRVQARQHHVLVVARIAENRRPARCTRQVLEQAAEADLELDRGVLMPVKVR
jgi:hypothetical protein